jgi:hypothetical protein
LPTCTRRTGRNMSQQLAAGRRNMRWADDYLLLIPWRFSCGLKKRSWASLFPWVCCWSCVSLIHLGSYCSRCRPTIIAIHSEVAGHAFAYAPMLAGIPSFGSVLFGKCSSKTLISLSLAFACPCESFWM